MAGILSAAEEAGVPFEKRCQMAEEHLRGTWELIQEMATTSLNSQQMHSTNTAKARSLLKEIEDQRAKGAGVTLFNAFDEFWKKMVEADQLYFEKAWDTGVTSSRSLFGTDATDFALKAIRCESSGN